MKYRPTPPFIAALAALLALATFAALADDTLTWVHPTQYTDNSPINAADIASTVVRYGNGTTANPPTQITALQVPAPARTVVVPRDATLAGTVCYQAATLMKPVPPASGGAQSNFAPAAWVCKTQTAPAPLKPRPPTGLAVQ